MIDRLMLNEQRIDGICDECLNVAGLEDHVGKIMDEWSGRTDPHTARAMSAGVVGMNRGRK